MHALGSSQLSTVTLPDLHTTTRHQFHPNTSRRRRPPTNPYHLEASHCKPLPGCARSLNHSQFESQTADCSAAHIPGQQSAAVTRARDAGESAVAVARWLQGRRMRGLGGRGLAVCGAHLIYCRLHLRLLGCVGLEYMLDEGILDTQELWEFTLHALGVQ